ncbi:MAG: flippase-like domain-containing protein [Actinobacteria bacterium]|nr:flippase-like domain-containing protein [Actinomycetota bacterium]
MLKNKWVRVGATVVVTGAAIAYIVSKIDLGKTAHIIGNADPGWLALTALLTFVTVPPQAWRWQLLLRVRDVHEPLGWLTRAYFVSYAVGQILPTAVGGDASRIYETTKRHPGYGSPIAGSVLLERALGGAVTLVLAGVGFLLAIGRYNIGAYLWVEALFVGLTILAGIVLFSRRIRALLRFSVPLLRRIRVERIVRLVYEGIHGYREHLPTLATVSLVTAGAQFARIVAIWASAHAVGIHLSLRPYIVLGPLLFLVMLVPFTINGLAVREAFFVNFLGKLGVSPDPAFACGFLFFVMTVLLALPGLFVILWEGMRRRAPASVADV